MRRVRGKCGSAKSKDKTDADALLSTRGSGNRTLLVCAYSCLVLVQSPRLTRTSTSSVRSSYACVALAVLAWPWLKTGAKTRQQVLLVLLTRSCFFMQHHQLKLNAFWFFVPVCVGSRKCIRSLERRACPPPCNPLKIVARFTLGAVERPK